MKMHEQKTLKAYIAYFENLSPETIADIRTLVTRDFRFKDPFNDVKGVQNFEKIMSHMFAKLVKPSFTVKTFAASAEGVAFLKWEFCFRASQNAAVQTITGMSEVTFSKSGQIRSHIDYWDTGAFIYRDIPVLGVFIRLIERLLRAS